VHPYSLRAFQPYQEHGMGRHGLGDLNLMKKHKKKNTPFLNTVVEYLVLWVFAE